jgi:hypothetical protein
MLNTVDQPASHWVLKSVYHSLFIQTLFEHYRTSSPSFIMMHRDLKEVLPSYAYLRTSHSFHFFKKDQCNMSTTGRQVMHFVDKMLENLLRFRQANP